MKQQILHFALSIFLFSSCTSLSPGPEKDISTAPNHVERWERAVVDIQTILTPNHIEEYQRNSIKALEDLRKKNIISTQVFEEEVSSLHRTQSQLGTGVLVSWLDRIFLLTADHVLRHELPKYGLDTYEGEPVYKQPGDTILPKYLRLLPRFKSYADTTWIYRDFYPIDILKADEPHLLTRWPKADLAIWDLSRMTTNIKSVIEEDGYVPITVEDIDTVQPVVGQEIFAIGFPAAVSLLPTETVRDRSGKKIEYPTMTLPMVSWGKVGMSHPENGFTYIDVSIYPGNSGGPVVDSHSGRLVGIVSSQANEFVMLGQTNTNLSHRIPFGVIVNQLGIRELMEKHLSTLKSENEE